MKHPKFEECLAEAKKLKTKRFNPALDDLDDERIISVITKVIIELDLHEEAFIASASKGRLEKARAFVRKWQEEV